MCKCLYCYKELGMGQKDFHPSCARKFFGTKDVPLLEYKHEELDQLAEQVIRAQTSLTGVQPKLSLNLSKHDGCSRLTIVGLWGDYIFKPQTESYEQLPENEDLTMVWCLMALFVWLMENWDISQSVLTVPKMVRR